MKARLKGNLSPPIRLVPPGSSGRPSVDAQPTEPHPHRFPEQSALQKNDHATLEISQPAPFDVLPATVASLFNRSLALFLLLLSSPFFLCIALAIFAATGRPVFFRGRRLGLHKKPFTMYKFRTLVDGAHAVIGGQLLSDKHKLTTPLGEFLRNTRLDELPQLFNILKGDMQFLGPRPDRPEVYQSMCHQIPHYDRRFAVKPGLIGHSQLFTPHNTPKKVRTAIDNQVLKRKRQPLWEMLFVGYAAIVSVKKIILTLLKYAHHDLLRTKILRKYKEKRAFARVRPKSAKAFIDLNRNDTYLYQARVIDINDEALLLYCTQELTNALLRKFKLGIQVHRRYGRWGSRTATCTGHISQTRQMQNGWAYVIVYEPVTPTSLYFVHQYFLKKSLSYPYFTAFLTNSNHRG